MKGDVILSLEPKTWALSPLDQFPYLYNLKRHLLLVAYFLRRPLCPLQFRPGPPPGCALPDPGAEAAPTPETEVPVACSASEAARLELPVLDTHLTTTLPL